MGDRGVRSGTRVVVIAMSVALAAVAGWWLGSVGANAPGWGCPQERLGMEIIDGFGRDGSPTAMAAVRAWIPALVDDGTISAERLEEAFASSTGPTRYDPGTGELRVDGNLVAIIAAGRNPDGTWSVGYITQCMRPPATG